MRVKVPGQLKQTDKTTLTWDPLRMALDELSAWIVFWLINKRYSGFTASRETFYCGEVYMQEIPESVRRTVDSIHLGAAQNVLGPKEQSPWRQAMPKLQLRETTFFLDWRQTVWGRLWTNCRKYPILMMLGGGPDRDRTDDLFHAMEARSQLRHRPTLRKDSIYSR